MAVAVVVVVIIGRVVVVVVVQWVVQVQKETLPILDWVGRNLPVANLLMVLVGEQALNTQAVMAVVVRIPVLAVAAGGVAVAVEMEVVQTLAVAVALHI